MSRFKILFNFLKNCQPHELFFLLLILLLPIQLGKHYWFDWSYVWGLKIDYLSPTIYLTDLLVLLILGSWGVGSLLDKKINIKSQLVKNIKIFFLPLGIFCFLLVNSFLAINQGAAFYKLIKIIELFFLAFYVAKNNNSSSMIYCLLPIALIYGSLITIAQFIKQTSLGGIFYWLGERSFSLATPGIAKAVVGGRLILRPYGTFPHPNVLAGFFLISLLLVYGLRKGALIRKSKEANLVWFGAISLGLVTLALSFSRSVWLMSFILGIGCLIKFVFGKKKPQYFKYLAIGMGVILIGLFKTINIINFVLNLSTKESIYLRLKLNQLVFQMLKGNYLSGIGLNNFIVRLSDYWSQISGVRFFQPVHNIFLLVLVETGLVGLLIFVWLLILTFKRLLEIRNLKLVIPFLAILSLGMVDHYWITLQQTQLLLMIVVGLSWGLKKA
ncbi:O-antigen ligase family protein [Patescibacteria group bacterium]